MIIVSIYEYSGITRIVFDDGTEQSLRTEYLEGRALEAGTAGPEDEAAILFACACACAEAAALKLVSRAEQCERGLCLKLAARSYAPKAAARAVSRLAACGLVDDRRYARLWLESRLARKADSPRALRARLAAKGIDGGLVKAALCEALPEDAELDLLRRYIERNGALPKAALRAEGFSSSAIEAAL